MSCPGCPVPDVLSRMSCPRCSVRLSCPGCPVPAILSRLSCPGYLVPAILSRLSCPGYPVRLSCPSCPIPAVLSRLSCPSSPVAVAAVLSCCHDLTALSTLDLSGRLVWTDLSRLFYPSFSVPDVQSRLVLSYCPPWSSCPSSPILVVLSSLSCSGRPVLSVLSWLYYPDFFCGCPVSAVLSKFSYPSCPALLLLFPYDTYSCPQLSCPCCLVVAVLPWLACSLCSVQADLSRLTCQAALSLLNCPGRPVPVVRPQVSCTDSIVI
jgi:hypothetical protein